MHIYKKCTYKFFINLETVGTVLQHRAYLLSCTCYPEILKSTLLYEHTDFIQHYFTSYTLWWGTAAAQWLRCCATNRKVGGSILADAIGIFR